MDLQIPNDTLIAFTKTDLPGQSQISRHAPGLNKVSRHILHHECKPFPATAWKIPTCRLFPITAGITAIVAILATTACKPAKQTGAGDSGNMPLLPTASGGQGKILSTLEEMGMGTNREHSFFGAGKITELRESLEKIPPREVSQLKPRILYELGREELRMNNLEEGISRLKEALKLAPEVNFPSSTLRDVWMNRLRFNLGVGYLRLGETENCCQRYTAESCIVPIRGTGIHSRKRGSQQAIGYLAEVLDHPVPDEDIMETLRTRLAARWLINIAYMTLGDFPAGVPPRHRVPDSLFESEISFPKFENIGIDMKLDTFNLNGGVIVDDFDNDGYLDILTSTWDLRGQTRFFHNDQDGTFSDRTEAAGLTGFFGGLHLIQGDYNNDGYLDLVILRGAWHGSYGKIPNSLLRNNRDGTFTDVTMEAGLGQAHYPTQTGAWADYDNDGDLDLYIGNESEGDVIAPTQLFRNNGNGTFSDVAQSAGVRDVIFAKGAAWGDIDGDRFPDLYVSVAGGANRMYRNNRDGTFTDVAPELDLTSPKGSFATWFWDYNNDGKLDLWVGSSTGPVGLLLLYPNGIGNPAYDAETQSLQDQITVEPMKLYEGLGSGRFRDVAPERQLHYPSQPMGSNFGDLNNDGFLDFYLGTGDVDYAEIRPNVMFLSEGSRRFINVTMAGGFGHLQKGHGVSFADLDNDGDQDVYIQMGGAQWADKFYDAIFENPGFGNRSLTVILEGRASNRSAIGARIKATFKEGDTLRHVYRHVGSGSSFGNNPLRQSIGIGKASHILALEVFWPTTGKTQTFSNVAAGKTIKIIEGKPTFDILPLKQVTLRAKDP